MQDNLHILMAQINPIVGDFEYNRKKIIDIIKCNQKKADIIIFPELALTGYPPEDLLFRHEFHTALNENLAKIQAVIQDCHIILGHPTKDEQCCYNSLSVFYQGQIVRSYHKQKLPNYDVFDEARYFIPGENSPCLLEIKGYKIGLCICEDLWQHGPVDALIASKVSLILAPNASPFDHGKYNRREKLLKTYAALGVAFVYVNQIGGQDELLFDGQSFAMDNNGSICARAPAFEEALCWVDFDRKQKLYGEISPLLSQTALIYKGLVCGTKDYVQKNDFPGVILGLSGGIDSALTLAIAVDALGADRVLAIMLPSRYTRPMSNDDAILQLETQQVSYSKLSIEPTFKAILSTLEPVLKDREVGITEENIQARIRGLLLMAISNKTGKIVLITSNKSELAVGYSTLYGDMAGGFAVLKDVLKTEVYSLAQYRNSLSEVIPKRVQTRAPSAELRQNQTDEDSLPEYAILDAIIVAYMINGLSPAQIIDLGFAPDVVHQVIHLIIRNEYKRRQAPIGIKISPTAFGKDWRYPITNGFK